jgi:hypothetical protein
LYPHIEFSSQEKDFLLLNASEMAVGSHHPFPFAQEMSFLEGSPKIIALIIGELVAACTLIPVSKGTWGMIVLGTSAGQILIVDLDASISRNQFVFVNVFKGNVCNGTMYYSPRDDGGYLFVGGEMCDSIVYWVSLWG